MKELTKGFANRAFFTLVILFFLQLTALAHDAPKVEVNGNDVGTWIGHNWMWVIGLIILLIVIIAAGGRKRRTRTTTTTIRRDDGNVTRTTTIEGE